MGKVVRSWKELTEQLSSLRKGKKVVFTNGCFDILHVGHVRYLQEARAQGDLLVLGLNSDASVRELKGPDRPVQSEEDRAEILAALSCIDFVVIFGEQTAARIVETVRPDIYVKGGDYKIEETPEGKVVLGYGGKVKALQFVPGRSTSSILNKVK